MILRRRRHPERVELPARSFADLVPVLERAKAALTEAVPSARVPGRPLAEALVGFESGLHEVREAMPAWRAPEIEEVWLRCSGGVERSLAKAEHVRLRGEEPEGFEALIELVADLLTPLEPFHDAAARFREVRG